jgi:hypothetical protein
MALAHLSGRHQSRSVQASLQSQLFGGSIGEWQTSFGHVVSGQVQEGKQHNLLMHESRLVIPSSSAWLHEPRPGPSLRTGPRWDLPRTWPLQGLYPLINEDAKYPSPSPPLEHPGIFIMGF